MAEGVNRGVRGAFQNGGNLYSLRHRRKIDNPTRPSADSYDNDLGCFVPFVEVLHQKETKKSNTGLSYQDARGCGGSPIDDQKHIFNINKEDYKKCTKKKKRRIERKKKIQERKSVNQYMFGASLRCVKAQTKQEGALIYRVNKTASERRVEMIPTLFQNAPITEEYAGCSQAWGNCS